MVGSPVDSNTGGSTGTLECPVDHNNPEVLKNWLGKGITGGKPEESAINGKAGSAGPTAGPTHETTSGNAAECPVDHTDPEVLKKWRDHGANGGEGLPPLANVPSTLSSTREVSSIPRAGAPGGDAKWIYPSEQQFFSAMKRKNHNPNARDMPAVIPIHNAVNERTWSEILRWEQGWGGAVCGGPRLVKFEGDASKLTPRARWNMMLGNTRPFDRHDWLVDRCGKRVEYVIDYYTGQVDPQHPERPSFYLDVRPKLNSLEGVKMRLWKAFVGE